MTFLVELSQRRRWHPTPGLLPGKSHGWRSLVGCSPWVTKSQTRLSDFTFTFHFHALEKEMATHSSVLAWRIPGMGEPGSESQTRLKWLSSSSSNWIIWTFIGAIYCLPLQNHPCNYKVFLCSHHGYPLQDSCLENSMDRRAWQATVHRSQRVRHDWETNGFSFNTFHVVSLYSFFSLQYSSYETHLL